MTNDPVAVLVRWQRQLLGGALAAYAAAVAMLTFGVATRADVLTLGALRTTGDVLTLVVASSLARGHTGGSRGVRFAVLGVAALVVAVDVWLQVRGVTSPRGQSTRLPGLMFGVCLVSATAREPGRITLDLADADIARGLRRLAHGVVALLGLSIAAVAVVLASRLGCRLVPDAPAVVAPGLGRWIGGGLLGASAAFVAVAALRAAEHPRAHGRWLVGAAAIVLVGAQLAAHAVLGVVPTISWLPWMLLLGSHLALACAIGRIARDAGAPEVADTTTGASAYLALALAGAVVATVVPVTFLVVAGVDLILATAATVMLARAARRAAAALERGTHAMPVAHVVR